jgi:hypothetical protein
MCADPHMVAAESACCDATSSTSGMCRHEFSSERVTLAMATARCSAQGKVVCSSDSLVVEDATNPGCEFDNPGGYFWKSGQSCVMQVRTCVRACVRVCVCVCVHACVCACAYLCDTAKACVRWQSLAHPIDFSPFGRSLRTTNTGSSERRWTNQHRGPHPWGHLHCKVWTRRPRQVQSHLGRQRIPDGGQQLLERVCCSRWHVRVRRVCGQRGRLHRDDGCSFVRRCSYAAHDWSV